MEIRDEEINELFPVKVAGTMPAAESERNIAIGMSAIKLLKAQIKGIETAFELEAIKYMKENKIYSIEVSDTVKLILGKKKTDRFESDFIKEKLGFTKEQLAVLPKNPQWKKKAILANNETSCAHSIEEKDELEIVELDTKYLDI
jgi:hypothetical protein